MKLWSWFAQLDAGQKALLACIGIFIALVGFVFLMNYVFPQTIGHSYRHFNANVERVDEESDGLEVYHDHARGVTCYRSGDGLSCVADLYLNPHSGAP